ncbi:MAG: hypothetical protein WKG00_15685 [Polyangiaceae bacterium]
MARRAWCGARALLGAWGAGWGGQGVGATVAPTRESGQSSLMDDTVAGRGKCDPERHDRPFIIEWDATDTSSFEARAASDVVFVKYQGCQLTVLDGCADDSVRGAFGSYRPVDWTSGSVEKIDIENEDQLYAELPLGVASLGGRVASGERFHMEYFVAGTRTATRAAVFRRDLERISACRGATHFVYGMNLGAFALGSTKNIEGQVGAEVWGAGAGLRSKNARAIEKKGGLLASCRGERARDVESCKTPIRLTLRAIADGDNPDTVAAVQPDSAASLNAAGKINQERAGEKKSYALYQSALQKMQSRDGKGCLADLDARDRLDPGSVSSNPRSTYANMRATCLMLSGQCAAGKSLDRKVIEGSNQMRMGPEMIDRVVDDHAASYCQGALSPRDRVLQAGRNLAQINVGAVPLATCRALTTSFSEAPKLKPAERDAAVEGALRSRPSAIECFAKAGDCPTAWKVFRTEMPSVPQSFFDKEHKSCAGKYKPDAGALAQNNATSALEALGTALGKTRARTDPVWQTSIATTGFRAPRPRAAPTPAARTR